MAEPNPGSERCFKTAWFAKAAKKDRDNIEADELVAFRQLAKSYEELSDQRINQLLHTEDIMEICHDDKAQTDRPQV
jgi:hypothetical protein